MTIAAHIQEILIEKAKQLGVRVDHHDSLVENSCGFDVPFFIKVQGGEIHIITAAKVLVLHLSDTDLDDQFSLAILRIIHNLKAAS
jgi:hypothetical protein